MLVEHNRTPIYNCDDSPGLVRFPQSTYTWEDPPNTTTQLQYSFNYDKS